MPATTPATGVIGRSEPQEIQARHRPRAHGEHIAQNAAHAGRRALIGLDIARMVVALHLEGHDIAIADIHHARILARAMDHAGTPGGQRLEVHFRGFVGAMLVPHRRDDAKLGDGRHPPDQRDEALIFIRLQPMRLHKLGGDLGFVLQMHRATSGMGAL
jgi:hypothetical protein